MSPLDRQTGSQMPDSSLGRIVRCLGLGDVDNRAGHAPNEDHAAFRIPLHQMPGHAHGKVVGSIDIDAP